MSQSLSTNTKKRFTTPIIILCGIMVLSSALMLTLAKSDSAIMDELAHIPAGYSYVHNFDYRINPEHPPLIKAIAASPLLLLNLSFPTDNPAWTTEINGQWNMGRLFLYTYNSNMADTILFVARLGPILIMLLLILLVFLWSRRLVGDWWALVPTLLIGLSPNLLAHGHYVTTDVGAALGFVVGLYTFARYIKFPSKKTLIVAGIFFGIAQMLKFSTVLLVPMYIIIAFIYWLSDTETQRFHWYEKSSLRIAWHYLRSLILIWLIGFVIVGAVYAVFTINEPIARQTEDATYILRSFSHGPSSLGMKTCLPPHLSMRCLAETDIRLTSLPIIRGIGQYMLGVLMVIQRSAGGNTAYFLGMVNNGGWWYYFPVVFLLKESLPALIFMALALLLALRRIMRNEERKKWSGRFHHYISNHVSEVTILVAVLFYWAYSMHSTLNIGFRHILPTIPLLYILATVSIKKWFALPSFGEGLRGWIRRLTGIFSYAVSSLLKTIFLAIILIWFVIEVGVTYPFYLSYFNEIGGGIWGGHDYVTDSNYDWGQDLKRLATFVQKNNIKKIAVDYFGGGDVGYYLHGAEVNWNGSKPNPATQGIEWLAVSINTIESVHAKPGQWFTNPNANDYSYITHFDEPYARAGTTIFIYKLVIDNR